MTVGITRRGLVARPPAAEGALAWMAEHDPVEAIRAVAQASLTAVRKTSASR